MSTAEARTTWLWEPAGKAVHVELSLDVVDRLGADAIRGLGAVPKRGLEIGGLLLGTVEQGTPARVVVTDFEVVPSDYVNGPVYTLSDADRKRFAAAVARHPQAVGWFRSHTRGDMRLADDDVALTDRFFPGESALVLMVCPAVLRPSTAAFFVREDGKLPSEPAHQWTFRRREMGGGDPPRRRALGERPHSEFTAPPEPEPSDSVREHRVPIRRVVHPSLEARPTEPPPPPLFQNYEHAGESKFASRAGWAVFLLLLLAFGMVAGYHLAGGRVPPAAKPAETDPFAIGLTAAPGGDGVLVRWNLEAPAIRRAERAVLTITESGGSKEVELDGNQLRNGSVLYHNVAPEIRFTLQVVLPSNRSTSESVTWRNQAATPQP